MIDKSWSDWIKQRLRSTKIATLLQEDQVQNF
jgi:hypothetical protein